MKQHSWTLLMVDDDEDDYLITRQMLTEAAFADIHVEWANSYQAGWEKLQAHPYDAVLVDYDLGMNNGLELIQAASSMGCQHALILFTGRGSYEVDLQAMAVGADLYLTKSEVNPLLLERGIRYAIERKQNELSLRQANQELERLNQSLQEELAWREKAELALRESERQQRETARLLEVERSRLAAVLEHLPVGVWLIDPTGRLVGKNVQADQVWGGDAPLDMEIERYPEYSAWFADSGQELSPVDYPAARTILTGQPAGPVELNIRRFDGTHGTVLVSAAPIFDSDGTLTGAVAINMDITELAHAKEALLESEAQFRALVSASSQVIFRMSPDWKTMTWLQGGSILSIPGSSVQNWLQDYIPPLDHAAAVEVIEQAIQTGKAFELEHQVVRADGSLGWMFSRAVPLYNAAGEIVEWFGAGSDITERKQVEVERERLLEENRQQRAFLERLVQAVPVAIAVLQGPDHRYTLTNPHQEHLSRGKGSLVGRSVSEVWAESADEVLPLLDRVYQTGETFAAQDVAFHMIRDRGPEVAHFDISYIPLRDPQGEIEGIMALAVETTEQVAFRKELEQQKNLLQAIFDHAPVGIAVVEGAGLTYVMANRTYENIPGKQDRPILGSTVLEMFPDVEASGGLKYVKAVLDTGQENSLPEFGLRVEEEARQTWWKVAHIPLPDEEGNANRVLILSLDITDQVNARQALEAEQARLLAVINSAPEGIVVADENAGLLLTNEIARQLYARPIPYGEDYTRHAELQICYPDGRLYDPRDLPLTRSALDGETFNNLEMQIIWPDGQRRPLLVNTAPVHDAQGRVTGAVGVFQDITRLKQVELDLEYYAARLEQSNRDLEDFAFIASHDLQEPLRKVVSFSDRLKVSAEQKLDEEERDFLDRMSSAAQRMAIMLNDLLHYSRVNSKAMPYREVNLGKVVAGVLQDLDMVIESSEGKVEVDELPVIEAEPTQMRQLFQNLIGNALKFARPGTPPHVWVHCQKVENELAGQEMVEIKVKDNGIGFDPSYKDHLFMPFHRLVGHSEYQGSGMGLAICRKIVERHAGTIQAEAQPGQGAVMTVRLPVRQGGSSGATADYTKE